MTPDRDDRPTLPSGGGRRPLARLRRLLTRLVGGGRPEEDRELDQELEFHLEMETDKYVQRGMSRDQAERLARIRFGAIERAKEECREERQGSQLDMLMQDVRYAFRTLLKSPGFTAAAVVTLALGIGANAAIFSVIYGVLLRPLPYRDGDELVTIQPKIDGQTGGRFSIQEVYDLREQASSFENIVEWHQMFFILLNQGEPQRVNTSVVSDNFFDTLGVQPLYGRTFVDGEDDLDSEPVLVLSYGYWQRAFGGDPDVVGRVFEMNTKPHTVVGILPPIPQFPVEADVYMPTSACPFRAAAEQRMDENRQAFSNLVAFARLDEGATIANADAEAATLVERFQSDYPDAYGQDIELSAAVLDLKDQLIANARPTMLMLLATAGLVLLIACANVANLTLSRVIRRERELAVRSALGAARSRLLRQLVTESTVLSLIGGACGLVVAYLGLDLLIDFAGRFTTRAVNIEMDFWVLAFTLAVSLATGVVFGSTPVLVSRHDLASSFRDGGKGSESGNKSLMRRGLIVTQVALAFVLLVGAGLTLRSVLHLQSVDPGFNTESVLTARVSTDFGQSMADRHDILGRIAEELGDSPFTQFAALTSKPPYTTTNPFSMSFLIEGRPAEDTRRQPQVYPSVVTKDYFDALEIPLLAGRVFELRDQSPEANPVGIISRSLADRYWQDESPVGRRVSLDGGDSWITVVGVVGDVKIYGPDRPVLDELYRPFTQFGMPSWIVVRTVGEPTSAARQLKEVAHAVSGTTAISDIQTLATMRADAVSSPRLTAMLLGAFSLLALVVTLTGIFGVMAYSVSQRTRELGIRLALGAGKSGILGMVLRQGLTLVAVGLLIGFGGAWFFGRVLGGMLFEIAPTDPITYGVVTISLLAAALLACLLPARRATAVDPVIALRNE